MTNFKCYKCGKEFSEEKTIISHLKTQHFCKDNTEPLKCVINYTHGIACVHAFLTFNGLRKHLKSCLKKKENDAAVHTDIVVIEKLANDNNSAQKHSDILDLLELTNNQLRIDDQVQLDYDLIFPSPFGIT